MTLLTQPKFCLSSVPTDSEPAVRTIRLLAVEDDSVDAEIIDRALHKTEFVNYKVTHASSLAKAFKAVCTEVFDVILLDLGLPDGSAMDGLSRLVGMLDVPVIVLTGDASSATANTALERGAQDFVCKSEDLSVVLDRTIQFAIQRLEFQAKLTRTEQMLSVQHEFSKLQAAKLQLRLDAAESHAKLATTSDQAVAIIDQNGRVEWKNAAFGRRFSVDCEGREQTIFDCLKSRSSFADHEQLQQACDTNQKAKWCWTSSTDDGQKHLNRVELIPVDEAGGISNQFVVSVLEEVVEIPA